MYLVLVLGLLVAAKLTWEWVIFQRRARQITSGGPRSVPRPPRQVRYDDTPILASEDNG